MIKISRYFENPFDDPAISAEELRIFSEDHLGKLNAQNASGPLAGTLTAMLAATQTPFGSFDAALSARAGELGALQGETLTKDDALRLFRTTIRQRQGRVLDKLGEDSPAYLEIFPGGLSYYTRATMQNIQQRFDYAVKTFTKYSAQLGPELAAEFVALRTSFMAARSGQVEGKGEVGEARGTVKATRHDLELQLFDNLLTLAKMFKDEPARAAEFFDQSLLEDPVHAPTPPPATP